MRSESIGWIVLVLLVLAILGTRGQAQAVGTSVQPVNGPTYQVADHPMHADVHDLRPEVSLIGGSSYTYAQGERPTWEFGSPVPPPTPLGDVARAARKEHAAAEKAQIHWNQQGQ